MRLANYSQAVIWERIVDTARSRGVAVPSSIRQLVFGYDPTEQTRVRPHEVRPTGEREVRVEGRVLSIDKVNFFRRFGYQEGELARALLGDLAKVPHMEVMLREDPDEQTRVSNDFRFFVPEAPFQATGVRVNSRALAILTTKKVRDQQFWFAQHVDRPW